MSVDSNVSGVVLPQSERVADSNEARAIAALARYLLRAPDRTDTEDLIARDAYLSGYRDGYWRGGHDASESWTVLCTALNDKRLQLALATLLHFVSATPEQRSEHWRAIKKA